MIITPETHPDHDIVGHDLMGHDGCRYFCDSLDTTQGYWITPRDPEYHDTMGRAPERRNISDRAIGRTFYLVHSDSHGEYCHFFDYLRKWNDAHRETV